MTTDRIKLAEELEAAEGPSRELDARIALYVLAKLGCVLDYTPEKALQELPNLCLEYTSSIDAAMTLVPEGWSWTFGSVSDDGIHSAGWATLFPNNEDGTEYEAKTAATPALAICAAALKAGDG